MIEITVPVLPESVTEGTLTTWCKQEGEHVKRDDVIAELETDKVILEIPAPHDGVLSNIIVSEGSTVTSAQLLADAPRDKCAHFREINGIAAAFQYLQKNYIPTALSFL